MLPDVVFNSIVIQVGKFYVKYQNFDRKYPILKKKTNIVLQWVVYKGGGMSCQIPNHDFYKA